MANCTQNGISIPALASLLLCVTLAPPLVSSLVIRCIFLMYMFSLCFSSQANRIVQHLTPLHTCTASISQFGVRAQARSPWSVAFARPQRCTSCFLFWLFACVSFYYLFLSRSTALGSFSHMRIAVISPTHYLISPGKYLLLRTLPLCNLLYACILLSSLSLLTLCL